MKREEVIHLSELARIRLGEDEIERLGREFSAILSYVDQLKVLAHGEVLRPQVGRVHNVFREDGDAHAPGLYTEDLLNAAPAREGAYVRVKKILNP